MKIFFVWESGKTFKTFYRIGRKPCVMYGMVVACIMSVGAVVCQIFEKEEEVTDGELWKSNILYFS